MSIFNMFLLSLCPLLTTPSFSSQSDWFSNTRDENQGDVSLFSSPNGAFADSNTLSPSITPHDNTAYLSASPDSQFGLVPNEEAATNGQIASSETPSGVPNPISVADRQNIAFQEGDRGVDLFPWNLIPALGGDKSWIDLPSLIDGTPLPTIPSEDPSPQAGRYDDNERLADPKNPDCDGGKHAMCCSVPAPMQPLAAHNIHKRRRCYLCMVP